MKNNFLKGFFVVLIIFTVISGFTTVKEKPSFELSDFQDEGVVQVAEELVVQELNEPRGWSLPSEPVFEFTVSSNNENVPTFLSGKIDPLDVKPDDIQSFEVNVHSSVPLKRVWAEVERDNGVTTIDLLLLNQSGNRYLFAGKWVVFDTHERVYHTSFYAEDVNGGIDDLTLAWSDPCENNDLTASTMGTGNCTVNGVGGVDNDDMLIEDTLTVSSGSQLVFNPGKSFSFAEGGKIVLAVDAEIIKGYLFLEDGDDDKRTPLNEGGGITIVVADTESKEGYMRVYESETTKLLEADCDDSEINIYRNISGVGLDADGDKYTVESGNCVGDNITKANGETYYADETGAFVKKAPVNDTKTGLPIIDCNDGSGSVWYDAFATDVDNDGFGVDWSCSGGTIVKSALMMDINQLDCKDTGDGASHVYRRVDAQADVDEDGYIEGTVATTYTAGSEPCVGANKTINVKGVDRTYYMATTGDNDYIATGDQVAGVNDCVLDDDRYNVLILVTLDADFDGWGDSSTNSSMCVRTAVDGESPDVNGTRFTGTYYFDTEGNQEWLVPDLAEGWSDCDTTSANKDKVFTSVGTLYKDVDEDGFSTESNTPCIGDLTSKTISLDGSNYILTYRNDSNDDAWVSSTNRPANSDSDCASSNPIVFRYKTSVGTDVDFDGAISEIVSATSICVGDSETKTIRLSSLTYFSNAAGSKVLLSADESGGILDYADCLPANESLWFDGWSTNADGDNYGGGVWDCNNGNIGLNNDAGVVDCNDVDNSGENVFQTPASISGVSSLNLDDDHDGYYNSTLSSSTVCVGDLDSPVNGYYTDVNGLEYSSSGTSGECNDNDDAINPGATETCGASDLNCDGYLNLDVNGVALTTTGNCNQVGACSGALKTCASNGSWGGCSITPATETCNGVDDDCVYGGDCADLNCDGYLNLDDNGDALTTTGNCNQVGACSGALKTCASNGSWGGCSITPATETCNGVDDDCDGIPDIVDGEASDCTTYYYDGDRDTYGLSSNSNCLCAVSGNYDVTRGGDCNDSNIFIYQTKSFLVIDADQDTRTPDTATMYSDCVGAQSSKYVTSGAQGSKTYYYFDNAFGEPAWLDWSVEYDQVQIGEWCCGGRNWLGFCLGWCPTYATSWHARSSDCLDSDSTKWKDWSVFADGDDDKYRLNSNVIRQECANDIDPDSTLTYETTSTTNDCDDSVASCKTDCTSLKYLDGDDDGYTNLTSFRACDAPANYKALSIINDECDSIGTPSRPIYKIRYATIDHDADGYIFWPDPITPPLYTNVCLGDVNPSSSLHFIADNGYYYYTGDSVVWEEADCDDFSPDCNVDCSSRKYLDNDRDTYGTTSFQRACDATGNYDASVSGDCNDDPNANGVRVQRTVSSGNNYCIDNDRDGYIDMYAECWAVDGCVATGWFGPNNDHVRDVNYNYFIASDDRDGTGDCDDSRSYVNPGRPSETGSYCSDGLDNDCVYGGDCADINCVGQIGPGGSACCPNGVTDCPTSYASGNNCNYDRLCGSNECGFRLVDTDKECADSRCTSSGWFNDCFEPCPGDFPSCGSGFHAVCVSPNWKCIRDFD